MLVQLEVQDTYMFTKVHKTMPSSYFRANLAKALKDAKKKPLVITTERGLDQYVIFSVDAYNKMIEAYEDEMDAAILAKLIAEDPSPEGIPWEEVKKRSRAKKT